MFCYLCGNVIRPGREGVIDICPDCSLHYCEGCAPNVESCYVCGAKPVKTMRKNVVRTDLSELFAEIAEDKRTQPRTQVRLECAYNVVREGAEDPEHNRYRALTRDVSRKGLSIYSHTPLEPGQHLSFAKCPVFANRKIAIVRWVKKTARGTYLAGLMFVSEPKNGAEPER